MPVRIAVDAMGGDKAPSVVVEGAIRALQNAGAEDLEILLFGPEAILDDELAQHEGANLLPIRVIDAPEVIGMGEPPATAVKTKQRSSIHYGVGAVKQGSADAFVSAGNTGAVMAASLFVLGRIDGVSRPSVIAFIPTVQGHSVLVDAGTNVDCKPEHLVQFAVMGSVYTRRVLQKENPTVGLLNIGEEPGKGDELAKAAHTLLEKSPDINFVGNIEGRDIFRHGADVIVCDGFVGNVLLKFGESLLTALGHFVGREMQRLDLDPEHQNLVMKVLAGTGKAFDYQEYGGAPLLGVNGSVMIGHGSSTARAIERMILAGAEVVRQNVPQEIRTAVAGA
jgi:phosphate acyltransferase